MIWLDSLLAAAKNEHDKYLLMSRKQEEKNNWPERTLDGKSLSLKLIEEYEEIGRNNLKVLTSGYQANQRLPRNACTFLAQLDESIADLYVDKPIPATSGAFIPPIPLSLVHMLIVS